MIRKYVWPAAAAGMVVCSAFIFTGCSQTAIPEVISLQNVENQVISVASREQVMVAPDVAEVVYSVYSQASDAQICQTQNNTDLEHVLTLLKDQGIEEKYIQTSNYGLSPMYDWNAGKTITGYEMNTDVTVSNIPIDNVGALLADSVDAGINSISSVTYKSSKYDESYQQALAKAIEAAKVKAQTMADAGGCKLGRIVNIEEHGGNQAVRSNYAAGAAESKQAVADMAVMPGEIEIEASINVKFSIN